MIIVARCVAGWGRGGRCVDITHRSPRVSFGLTCLFGQDPGDLAIKAGTRVFVTDKTSEDWSVF